MGRVNIDTQQFDIKEIFSDRFVFSIPRYQRPYAWTTMEAEVLLDDLLTAMEECTLDLEEVSPYFLGSIVLTKGDKPDSEVIDGQQRLTTITILLAALRASIRLEKAAELEKFLYEKANTFAGTPDRYRLTLRQRDTEFFQKYIQAEHGIKNLSSLPPMELSESQRNIRDNALAFIQRLQHLSEQERIRLGKFLVSNCFVVVISTEDFDTAYRMFSVLNNRGLNLSEADILKAQILGDIRDDEEQDEYMKKWEEIEVLLGNEDFLNLLKLIRILSPGPRMRKNLLEEFHTYVYSPAQQRRTPQDLIDRMLHPYGNILHCINTASYKERTPYTSEIEKLLRWLNRLTHTEWLPAALQYWGRYPDKPDLLLRFLRDLDRLSIGLMLLNLSRNKRTERYYKLQLAIREQRNLYSNTSPLQLTDEEQHNIYRALNGGLYVNVNTSLCKHILLQLDDLLSDGSASYNFPIISVEHVLPQRPPSNSEWTRWFPRDVHNRYVNQLGNLVLLSKQKNHAANNYNFATKKTVYFLNREGICPFALTSQVLSKQEWTPEVVQRRQLELVSKLTGYWNISNPSLQVVKRT